MLFTPIASFRWVAAGRQSATLALLACLILPLPAVAQTMTGERGDLPPAESVSLSGLGSAPSPFSGLFQPAAPVAFVRPNLAPVTFAAAGTAALADAARDCPGCPRRRPVSAILQTLGVNLAFNWMNRLRNPNDEFIVTFHSWWENLRYGFEWDYNSFSINQFGHPYQGNLYFNAGRANGLTFWESAPLAALGSATWEYFAERNHASINDFVTTTMGGIALGEMFHRAGWLLRDTTESGGKSRRRGELLAMLLDPITGANRFLSGDASRVAENPPDLKPTIEGGRLRGGRPVQRRDQRARRQLAGQAVPGAAPRLQRPLHVALQGAVRRVQPHAAHGRWVEHLRSDGARPALRPLPGDQNPQQTQFLVAQAYDYQSNGIFDYGGQSVVAGVSHIFRLSDSTTLAAFGVGGPIVLGAISSPVLEPIATPVEGEEAERFSGHTISVPASRLPLARRSGCSVSRSHA